MKHPDHIDPNNPNVGLMMPPGLYIHCRIAESEYLNWSEKALLGIMEMGQTDNKFLGEYMGFAYQTVRNMKSQISRKLKAHGDTFPGL